jgi:hypothetical protein
MTNDRRDFLAGLGVAAGSAAVGITNVPLVGLAAAQPTNEEKPFLHIPEDVSPEFQAYLRTLNDPALMPRFPDAGDLDSWKKVQAAAERLPEARESRVARKKIADFVRKYLGEAPRSRAPQ